MTPWNEFLPAGEGFFILAPAFTSDGIAHARSLQQVTFVGCVDEYLRGVATAVVGYQTRNSRAVLPNAGQRAAVDDLHTLFRQPFAENTLGDLRFEEPGQLGAIMLA